MGTIRLVALGAGQDVGRSCVVVTLGGRTVMFDCGMHMGFNDERRFPDFSLLSPTGRDLTRLIDCVIITHFHLDHCGALPYLTEMCGYEGPVFMTHPTKALCPILLEDYRRITVERRGESNFFTSSMIRACVARVTPLRIKERHFVGAEEDFEVRPYYAGHVLGAAMFYVRVGTESVLYTGDYNMTPDRHLGAASADLLLRPDLLITESTYATTLRDSKRARERDFLRNIHQCVAEGGKVLIPVFALGRVQELCILVEAYWERLGLNIPVYFSAGMAEAANEYYRVFVDWTNENIIDQLPVRNLFDFKHVKQFEKHYADLPGPMVLFSSPGMLHSGLIAVSVVVNPTCNGLGTSLEIFKKWCSDERNLLIIPGFCVSGTVGAKVLAGQRKIVLEETAQVLEVKMQVKNMSFSAHADARGIMQMIKTTRPHHVVLVHGEAAKMAVLKSQIISEMGIPCWDPPNGHLIKVESNGDVPVRVHPALIEETLTAIEQVAQSLVEGEDDELIDQAIRARCTNIPLSGCLSWSREDIQGGLSPRLGPVSRSEQEILMKTTVPLGGHSFELIYKSLQRSLAPYVPAILSPPPPSSRSGPRTIQCRSVSLAIQDDVLAIEWRFPDTRLAQYCIDIITQM